MNLMQALRCFGKEVDILAPVVLARSPTHAYEEWDKLYSDLKTIYKRRAFKTHPDRGGDVSAFMCLQEAWNFLSDPDIAPKIWHVHRQVVRQPQVQVRVVFAGGFTGDASTATTTDSTTTQGFGFGEPAFIRRM